MERKAGDDNNNNINLTSLVSFKNCFEFIAEMDTNYHQALLNGMDNDTNILFSTWVVHVSRSLHENWIQELVPLVPSEGAAYDPPPVRNQHFLKIFVCTNPFCTN